MISLSDAQITEALEPYGFSPPSQIITAIRTYIELLLKWNRTISLTAVVNVDEILRFHFGESLFALPMLPVEKSRLADVGSGAGFPGIPIAMASRSLHVTLIESNTKKCAFLNEVIRELKLPNVAALHARMEDVDVTGKGFDIVTARAVGNFDELLLWGQKVISPRGRVALWLGHRDVAKVSADSRWKWAAPNSIPGSQRRYILVGSPIV
jgi:16S rRNA (guanine527-N7)-methyltransferase